MKTFIVPRPTDTYYDRHRHCKGDSWLYEHKFRFQSEVMTSNDVLMAILDGQVPGTQDLFPEHLWNGVMLENCDLAPDWYALCQNAQFGYPNWYGNTAPKERKANKRQGASHCWVKIDSKFYDAFNPEGVDDESLLISFDNA